MTSILPSRLARRLVITGRVQGVGFRPFVSRMAREYGISGSVRNCGGEVEIFAEGEASALDAFQRALLERAPPLADPAPASVGTMAPIGASSFVIEASESRASAHIHLPPDYFVCDECLAEMQDPTERRYRYPFINCTQCGPRYTLIDRLPYDRPNTSMRAFRLCPECQTEYTDPLDRRYHAQPLACPVCGPSLLFRSPGLPDLHGNEAALASCIDRLRQGGIVAVKGIGGYHLLCDARDEAVVRRLRSRKPRPDKPLAVMVPWRGPDGLDAARTCATLAPEEQALLRSPLRPIVLVRKREGDPLAPSIAPGLNEVGLMLPYSPLHHLLADAYGAPLVATSANVSGEPVLTEAEEIETRLHTVADAFLHHDRPILRPADDSVFRGVAGTMRPMRLGRGSAPVELTLPFELPAPVLATGADLKNTIALGFGRRVVLSPHIGDLGSVRSAEVFEQLCADLQRLYGVTAERLICDAHPDYRSNRWARTRGLPVRPVFHHHAHASALVGEHGLTGDTLVFTWDGTGYGEDATIWGGETLLGSPGRWQRVGSLRPFRLPGGERAAREPWRCALALCWEIGTEWPDCGHDSALLRHAWERGIQCPATSSAGRLFDGAAALVGLAERCSYEGQAAMQLEAAVGRTLVPLPLPIHERSGLSVIDWAPLLPLLLDTPRSVPDRAAAFHASLAAAIANQAVILCERHGITQVGLAGGVFQNRVLTELTLNLLKDRGFGAYLPECLPCNDAAISFGQVIEAAAAVYCGHVADSSSG